MSMEVLTGARSASAARSLPRTGLLALFIFFTVSWFALLANRALFEPDEGRYAEIPREMVAGGDWITPHLDGLKYIEKPPLQYWFTAAVFKIFGESDFTARLCTGLAGYLSVVLVGFVASRLWGPGAAVRSVLLISASSLFVLLGHQLTLDMTLTFWMSLCLCCFLLAQSQDTTERHARSLMLASWASMALAVLTKGLIGVVVPGCTLVVYAIWQKDYHVFRRINAGLGTALFSVLAVPWFVAEARVTPGFTRFFFLREHFQRFLTPIEHRSEPWWYFAAVLSVGVLPWLPQALRALFLRTTSGPSLGQYDAKRLLQVWCLFVFFFFSMSDAKLIPYILPMLPALVLLCAARENPGSDKFDVGAGACLSLAAGLGLILYADATWSAPTALTQALRPALLATAFIVAAAGLLALSLLRTRLAASFGILCGGWYLGCVGLLLAAAGAQQHFSSKEIATALSTASPASPIFSVRTYQQSLPFYLRRTVTLVDYRDELDFGLQTDPELGIAGLDDFSKRWLTLDQAYAVMPKRVSRTLASQGLPMRNIGTYERFVVVARH